MKKAWGSRKDRSAVSPVIATILLVAISVVLASILYVLVLGTSGGAKSAPPVTMTGQASYDGSVWIVTISTVQSNQGVTKDSLSIKVTTPDGTQQVFEVLPTNDTQWEELSSTYGIKYVDANDNATATLQPGDTFLIQKSTAFSAGPPQTYPSGTKVELYHTNGLSGSCMLSS